MNKSMKTLLPLAVFAGFAVTSNAATIVYAGFQADIDADSNSSTDGLGDGWRNTAFDKPLDIDGDDVLGTDGYRLRSPNSNPTYATVTTVAANTNNGFGLIDDPANPTGSDVNGGLIHDTGNDASFSTTGKLMEFVISGTDLDGQTLRLGVLFDMLGSGTANFTLTQTSGGSATATTATLAYEGTNLDVAFFDITGAVAGDTFDIRATTVSGGNLDGGFAGLTFDTAVAVPEPSTTALLGLGGFALILRRRK